MQVVEDDGMHAHAGGRDRKRKKVWATQRVDWQACAAVAYYIVAKALTRCNPGPRGRRLAHAVSPAFLRSLGVTCPHAPAQLQPLLISLMCHSTQGREYEDDDLARAVSPAYVH